MDVIYSNLNALEKKNPNLNYFTFIADKHDAISTFHDFSTTTINLSEQLMSLVNNITIKSTINEVRSTLHMFCSAASVVLLPRVL